MSSPDSVPLGDFVGTFWVRCGAGSAWGFRLSGASPTSVFAPILAQCSNPNKLCGSPDFSTIATTRELTATHRSTAASRLAPAELRCHLGQDVLEDVGVVVHAELVRHGQ